MESVQLKIEFENALRRATVPRHETLAQLKRTIASLVGLEDCDVKYRDEEGDLITVGSDQELQDVLEAAGKQGKILRLIVAVKNKTHDSVPQAVPEPAKPRPAEPEVPWANLARALSEPHAVERIQQALQSPVITDAVNRAAKAYVDCKGDVVLAGLAASQHIPALLALVAELLSELPVLRDLQTLVMQWLAANQHHAPPPFAAFFQHHHGHHHHPEHHHGHHPEHHHGHHPEHHHGHHHHGGHGGHSGGPHCHKEKHFGVFCDGCSSDPQLKQASLAAGNQTRRGFISGPRFKSDSVADFDLCESCKGSNAFPDAAYGPFTAVPAPAGQQGPRGGRCGNGGGWWRGGGGGNWRNNNSAQQNVPMAAPVAPPAQPNASGGNDFFDAIRSALAKGAESFLDAAKDSEGGNGGDLSEIARAIAESLKQDGGDNKPKAQEEVKPAPAPQQDSSDPFVKWAAQLAQLQTLGFENSETYVDFLEQEKGDLDRVVTRIVSRDL